MRCKNKNVEYEISYISRLVGLNNITSYLCCIWKVRKWQLVNILCYVCVFASGDSPAESPNILLADIQKVKKLTLLSTSLEVGIIWRTNLCWWRWWNLSVV